MSQREPKPEPACAKSEKRRQQAGATGIGCAEIEISHAALLVIGRQAAVQQRKAWHGMHGN